MESNHRDDTKQNKSREDNELREFEWRFGLCRRHRVQGRHFFKRLHYQHEQIEIETDDSADRIDPAPRSCEMLGVTRVNRQRKKRQRYDSETDCRREPVKRKKESRDSRRDGGDQKPFRPAIQSFAREHSKQDSDAGEDGDQTNYSVNDRVDKEYHLSPFSLATT